MLIARNTRFVCFWQQESLWIRSRYSAAVHKFKLSWIKGDLMRLFHRWKLSSRNFALTPYILCGYRHYNHCHSIMNEKTSLCVRISSEISQALRQPSKKIEKLWWWGDTFIFMKLFIRRILCKITKYATFAAMWMGPSASMHHKSKINSLQES